MTLFRKSWKTRVMSRVPPVLLLTWLDFLSAWGVGASYLCLNLPKLAEDQSDRVNVLSTVSQSSSGTCLGRPTGDGKTHQTGVRKGKAQKPV